MTLPARIRQLMARCRPADAALTAGEQVLWAKLSAGANVTFAAPTRTKVDVGHWRGNARVRAAFVDRELLLFAAGKRPFIEWVPRAELHESIYNHVTGELVLAPAERARLKSLRLPPVEGRQLLEFIQGKRD